MRGAHRDLIEVHELHGSCTPIKVSIYMYIHVHVQIATCNIYIHVYALCSVGIGGYGNCRWYICHQIYAYREKERFSEKVHVLLCIRHNTIFLNPESP